VVSISSSSALVLSLSLLLPPPPPLPSPSLSLLLFRCTVLVFVRAAEDPPPGLAASRRSDEVIMVSALGH
jgi:hypothetical protein